LAQFWSLPKYTKLANEATLDLVDMKKGQTNSSEKLIDFCAEVGTDLIQHCEVYLGMGVVSIAIIS